MKEYIDVSYEIAEMYDGVDFCTLSKKEEKILNLFVDNGIGEVYHVYDVDGTTVMKYYKFNP